MRLCAYSLAIVVLVLLIIAVFPLVAWSRAPGPREDA